MQDIVHSENTRNHAGLPCGLAGKNGLIDHDPPLFAFFLNQPDGTSSNGQPRIASPPGSNSGLFEHQRVQANDATVSL
jgi:hypothetical protein